MGTREGFNQGKRAVKSTVKVQECRAEHDTRCCNKIVASTTFATKVFKNLGKQFAYIYIKNIGKNAGVETDDVIIRIQRIPEIQDLNSRISGIVIVFNTGRVKNKGCHFGGNDNF